MRSGSGDGAAAAGLPFPLALGAAARSTVCVDDDFVTSLRRVPSSFRSFNIPGVKRSPDMVVPGVRGAQVTRVRVGFY